MSQKRSAWSSFLVGVVATLALLGVAAGGALADRLFYIKPLDYILKRSGGETQALPVPGSTTNITQRVLTEESAVIEVSEKASPAVVTVSITTERQLSSQPFFMDPFGIFGSPFFGGNNAPSEKVEQDIGSGFVVDGENGLIVTNKHVVEDASAKYKVIDKDEKEYDVLKIYRDPANDLAIIKVDSSLPALTLGDSDQLRVGQFVIAIGTALGEFRHTVTTGVVSGLGRGIEAGGGWGGYVERLDNVIQTDAAINPGNSGGPLLNSAGQVIGVNVAVAQSGQNIGFAIPINVVKDSLTNFNQTGQFDRPFLGVRYRMILKNTALLNDVPEGAYIVEVVADSPADAAGLKEGDIVVKLNDVLVKEEEGGLATIINKLKTGQKVPMEVYRDGETVNLSVTMKAAEETD